MTFKDYGKPGILEVTCDTDEGCDAVTTVGIDPSTPGTNQLPMVKRALEDGGWSMTIIQNTWPGLTMCPHHNLTIVVGNKVELSRSRYDELKAMVDELHVIISSEAVIAGLSEAQYADLIIALDGNEHLEGFLKKFIAEPYTSYPSKTSPYGPNHWRRKP